jgi:molecular chaperone GrpE
MTDPATNPTESTISDPASDAPQNPAAEAASGLEAKLAVLQAQIAEQKDKYLRLAAEYENFRKRSVRERQEAEHKGMSYLIAGILDALDDLGRFAHVDPATVESAAVVTGAEMVEKKMLKSLAGHGLEVVNPVGIRFDPAVAEALTTVPAAAPDEVGYLFNGQLLRPARVVVKQWND